MKQKRRKKKSKEYQETIVISAEQPDKATPEEFSAIMRQIAPGTHFRTALEGSLRTGRGALIALEAPGISPLIDGGFKINCRFTPQKLIELTKMDGAIILSNDMKKILNANTLLAPSTKIRTNETGTRHKAAERVAKQIGTLAIAISERRNQITIFYKNKRHILKGTDEILRKANEHMQMLERQRELFEKNINRLTQLEIRNYESLPTAITVIQKGYLVDKIAEEIKKDIIELGNEGALLRTRLKEITHGVNKETELVIKDYTKLDVHKSRVLLDSLTYEEILNTENILKLLAYEKPVQDGLIDGWRVLSKTTLEDFEIAVIVKAFGSLGKALYSSERTIAEILGDDRAKLFKDDTDRIKMNA